MPSILGPRGIPPNAGYALAPEARGRDLRRPAAASPADAHPAATLREYLLRGGFPMLDDLRGPEEYAPFDETMRKVFPGRPVVDLPSDHPIFHVVYDPDHRFQVLGAWCTSQLNSIMCQSRAAGATAHRHGVYALTHYRHGRGTGANLSETLRPRPPLVQ